MDESVIKVIEALWSKSVKVSESPILARFTALGARVLKKVTEAIERTLYPDTEKELVVEYGLTEPNPDDKTYVHPLNDWETSNVTYYCDSFGQRVYLQLDGSSGILAATDYRDFYDEGEVAGEDCEEGEDGRGHTILGTKDSSVSEDDSSRPERIPGVPDTKDWSHDTNPL